MSEISFYSTKSSEYLPELPEDPNIYVVLVSILKEIACDETVNPTLRSKVQIALLQTEIKDIAKNIFEIRQEDTESLEIFEQKSLRKLVRDRITELGERDETDLKEIRQQDQEVLLETCKQAHKIYNEYIDNLSEYKSLLEQLRELRVTNVPDLCETKMKQLELKQKVNVLKASILEQKMKIDCFNENEVSFEAYKELLKDVQSQQSECEREINQLKSNKKNYLVVDCENFRELLREYKQYKKAIKKLNDLNKISNLKM